MLFVLALAALQADSVPDSEDYGRALQAWAKCTERTEAALSGQLLNHATFKKRLSIDCAIEEAFYQAAMTRFITMDGDPEDVARALAAENTSQTRDHFARIGVGNLERRFLQQDKVDLGAFDACLAKAVKANSKLTAESCGPEQAVLKASSAKRLKNAGVDDVVAKNIIANFIRRVRQSHVNAADQVSSNRTR